FFRLTQEPPATPLITVSQESLNLDGTTESFAERGVVELVGSLTSGSPWYFNFSWNDTWQVQNVPVLPEGSNDVAIREFEFLLGSNGVPVFLGNLGFTLTTNPVSQMPPSTNEEPVFGFPVVARSGIQGEPLIYFPGNPLIGVTNLALTNLNSAVASWGARFPNREQD